jgi:hypothetical protein
MASAASATGSPAPRPLAGSTGPETAAVADGCGTGVELGTGAWVADPVGRGDDELGVRVRGLGATCGPEPDALGAGVDVGDPVGVGVGDLDAVRVGVGDEDGAAPTVMLPVVVDGPDVAITRCWPDAVPM